MIYITVLTIALPRVLMPPTTQPELGEQSAQKLRQQIRSISIKVLAHGETIGSGILINRQDRAYTVVTNAHVIQASSAPFQLQTADGQIYAAALVPPPIDRNHDLSTLKFQSLDHAYPTAKIAPVNPKIGDRVWAAGFPLDSKVNRAPDRSATAEGLTIADGQITQILTKAITGGYSLGYDNPIKKGMSGGPLVNQQGELVGINGVHANPLWDTADFLEDGSTVNEKLQAQINKSSWAIPVALVEQF
jgi:S1-C subfamily serine protease